MSVALQRGLYRFRQSALSVAGAAIVALLLLAILAHSA